MALSFQEKKSSEIVLPGQPESTPVVKPAVAKDPLWDVGLQPEAVFNITKHIPARYDPSKIPKNGSWAGGLQQVDIREGGMTFGLENSVWKGKPCKLFRAQSNWEFHPSAKNKKLVLTPKLYVFAQISYGGTLLHMTTSYAGFGTPIQIDSVYNADSIDVTRTEGRSVVRTTLFPKFSMSLFDSLFDPLMKDGLVVAKERQLAFLHPITGAPCIVKATLNGRFNGKHEYREYHGYKIDVTSPDTLGRAVSFVSRHGQLIQVVLPENQDAISYTHVTNAEELKWGKFKPSDWDVPASQSHPFRTRHKTMGMPVYLTNPSQMLFPLPYAVAL